MKKLYKCDLCDYVSHNEAKTKAHEEKCGKGIRGFLKELAELTQDYGLSIETFANHGGTWIFDNERKVVGYGLDYVHHSQTYNLYAVPSDRPSDVVQVVRCKDCKYYEIHKPNITLNCERAGKLVPMMPNDYCSYGERKEK